MGRVTWNARDEEGRVVEVTAETVDDEDPVIEIAPEPDPE
jgi:hypothetical protein